MIVAVSYDDSIPDSVMEFIETTVVELFPKNLKIKLFRKRKIGEREFVEEDVRGLGSLSVQYEAYVLDMKRRHRYKNKYFAGKMFFEEPFRMVFGQNISYGLHSGSIYTWTSPIYQDKENTVRTFSHELAHFWLHDSKQDLISFGGHCDAIVDEKYCIMNINYMSRNSSDLVFCSQCCDALASV